MGRFLDNFPLLSLHSWENHHFSTKIVNFLPSMAPIFVKRFFGKKNLTIYVVKFSRRRKITQHLEYIPNMIGYWLGVELHDL